MITKASPAKVNLYLRVLRKREDGYHDILSLMQRISLCDEMIFAPTGGGRKMRETLFTGRRRPSFPGSGHRRESKSHSGSGSRSPRGWVAAVPTPRRPS